MSSRFKILEILVFLLAPDSLYYIKAKSFALAPTISATFSKSAEFKNTEKMPTHSKTAIKVF